MNISYELAVPPNDSGRHPQARVARRLARFHPRFRRRVSVLAAAAPRMGDLAFSFPALLVAIACSTGSTREDLCSQVYAGAPLRTLAARAGIPIWTRWLAPEAIARPLPPLPDSPGFRSVARNHLPRSPKVIPDWLDAVSIAHHVATEAVACWVAGQHKKRANRTSKLDRLRMVCLWAWYSENSPEQWAIELPWTTELAYATALKHARRWYERVSLQLEIGACGVADGWVRAGTFDGYEFVPLLTAEAIDADAEVLENCLRTRGWLLAANRTRVWSIRKEGRTVAAVELRRAVWGDPKPEVNQLCAFRNRKAPADVARAVRRWLDSQVPALDTDPLMPRRNVVLDRDAWRSQWRPYWLAKRRIPHWLPMAPCREALFEL